MPDIYRILSCAAALAVAMTPLTPAFAQTQTEMNEEAGKDLTKSDKKLNEIYRKLMAKISPDGQVRLREVEKTWILFRDQECDFETLGTVGGSVHPMVLLMCKTGLTDQRIKDLIPSL